jgi:hypothetical protein
MTRHEILAVYCLILALHALGSPILVDEPDYTIAGMFAALAGLFGIAALRRAVSPVGRIADET